MTVGKIQARSGKLPSAAELEVLAESHPPPPPMAVEVAVDERNLEDLYIALAHVCRRQSAAQAALAAEADKHAQWMLENRRRKHNYVPFIVNLLKLLAERGELMPLIDAAKAKKRAR